MYRKHGLTTNGLREEECCRQSLGGAQQVQKKHRGGEKHRLLLSGWLLSGGSEAEQGRALMLWAAGDDHSLFQGLKLEAHPG